MKKFIKAVVVASVLVSASTSFAVASRASIRAKPAADGTGGTQCDGKVAVNRLFDVSTNGPQVAAAKTQVIDGKTTK